MFDGKERQRMKGSVPGELQRVRAGRTAVRSCAALAPHSQTVGNLRLG